MIENDHHAAASIHKREEIKNASSTQVLQRRPVLRQLYFSCLMYRCQALGSANVPVLEEQVVILRIV